jgi:hypothetical protein
MRVFVFLKLRTAKDESARAVRARLANAEEPRAQSLTDVISAFSASLHGKLVVMCRDDWNWVYYVHSTGRVGTFPHAVTFIGP